MSRTHQLCSLCVDQLPAYAEQLPLLWAMHVCDLIFALMLISVALERPRKVGFQAAVKITVKMAS